MANGNEKTKVITGKVRLSYAYLFDTDQNDKYGVTILIPKSDQATLKKIKAAIQAAAENGKHTVFGGKIPRPLKHTLRDADSEEEEEMLEKNPEYAGHYFMGVRSKNRPGIVDADVQPILDSTEVYSGCYARVSMNAFAYKVEGNKGVTFGLNNVQKIADGDPLGGRSRAEDDFDEFEVDEDEDEDEDDVL